MIPLKQSVCQIFYHFLRCQNPLALAGGCRHRPIELEQGDILKKELTF